MTDSSESSARAALRSERFEKEALPHTDALLRTALRMTRNRADAEDLVAEAMLKAFRFYDRFEPGSNMRAWLFKIMINLFINQYRRKSSAPPEVSLDEMEEFQLYREMTEQGLYDPSRPDRQVFGELLAQAVRQEIDRLPEEFRTVAALVLLEGLSYQETAEILECELGTVKSRLFRARQILQRKLALQARAAGLSKPSSKP